MKVEIASHYSISLSSEYELPEGKTLDDIECIAQKWETVGIYFNDGTCLEVEEESFDPDWGDTFKRPNELQILNTGYEGKSWDGYGDGDEPYCHPPETVLSGEQLESKRNGKTNRGIKGLMGRIGR